MSEADSIDVISSNVSCKLLHIARHQPNADYSALETMDRSSRSASTDQTVRPRASHFQFRQQLLDYYRSCAFPPPIFRSLRDRRGVRHFWTSTVCIDQVEVFRARGWYSQLSAAYEDAAQVALEMLSMSSLRSVRLTSQREARFQDDNNRHVFGGLQDRPAPPSPETIISHQNPSICSSSMLWLIGVPHELLEIGLGSRGSA